MALRHWLCGRLIGHDYLRAYAPGRICLRCTGCGKESPGWDVPAKLLRFERKRSTAKAALRLARGRR